MSARRNRYLAFVDYLGTKELYQNVEVNAELIEDRRSEIEHAIQIRLQRSLASNKIEVGVFSDTVLIAGSSIYDVLSASASLVDIVLRKTIGRANPNDMRLLRGGISSGLELRSSYLRPSPSVSVIPFFDGSLAFAYSLEDVRRGSRLYISGDIPLDQLGELSRFVFSWKNMTGVGRPVSDIHEFLWPGFMYAANPDGLLELLQECIALWRSFLGTIPEDPALYRTTLYHFDETVKCIVRSFVSFTDSNDIVGIIDRLAAFLPSEEDRMDDCDIRYVWGIWFQIIYVMCRYDATSRQAPRIGFVFAELKRRGYLENFLAEIDCPDYDLMRFLIKSARAAQ
jgi:hypothetical protein